MRIVTIVLLSFVVMMGARADNGIISIKSSNSVAATIDKLQAVLESKGMTIMARVNHAAGAQKAGLELPPTELLIFGNPKIGTPLMLCQRSVAIDLPQKALAWEDAEGQVWLSYNDPAYLNQRHGLEACEEVLKKVSGALANFAKVATE